MNNAVLNIHGQDFVHIDFRSLGYIHIEVEHLCDLNIIHFCLFHPNLKLNRNEFSQRSVCKHKKLAPRVTIFITIGIK